MLPPGAIFEIKIHQNAFAAYWGSLQRSQTPIGGFGDREGWGNGGKKGAGEERKMRVKEGKGGK